VVLKACLESLRAVRSETQPFRLRRRDTLRPARRLNRPLARRSNLSVSRRRNAEYGEILNRL
jgi:hypothetical protein